MWVDKHGNRKVPYTRGAMGIHTPAWAMPVKKSTYILDESDEEVQRSPLYSPPKRRPEENGFYMPNSPFAKIAEGDGLDFNADKKEVNELVAGGAAKIAQAANDVFEEHHQVPQLQAGRLDLAVATSSSDCSPFPRPLLQSLSASCFLSCFPRSLALSRPCC